MNDDNRIHGDIEYLYVIKDSCLYYVNKWNLHLLVALMNKHYPILMKRLKVWMNL